MEVLALVANGVGTVKSELLGEFIQCLELC